MLFNIDKTHRLAKVAKEFGAEVAGAIMFTLSPVHTDGYYADKADKLSASPDIDTLLLYDTGGVLDPDRMRTLVPAIIANARGKPIEFHSNNLLGASGRAYVEAIKLGIQIPGRLRPTLTWRRSSSASCTPPAGRWRTAPRCLRSR